MRYSDEHALTSTHQIEWQTMQIKQSQSGTLLLSREKRLAKKKRTRWKSTIRSPLHVPSSSIRVIMCFSFLSLLRHTLFAREPCERRKKAFSWKLSQSDKMERISVTYVLSCISIHIRCQSYAIYRRSQWQFKVFRVTAPFFSSCIYRQKCR